MDGVIIIEGKKIDLTIKSLQTWNIPYQIRQIARQAHRSTPYETTICIPAGFVAVRDPNELFKLPGGIYFSKDERIFLFRKSAHIFLEDLLQSGDLKATTVEHGLKLLELPNIFVEGRESIKIDFPNLLILPKKNNIPLIIDNLKKFVGFRVVSDSKYHNICQKIIDRDDMCVVIVNNKVVLFDYSKWFNMFNVNINVSDKIDVNIDLILKKNYSDNLSVNMFPMHVLPFDGFEHPEKSAEFFKDIVLREFGFQFSKVTLLFRPQS
jgi:hypothetical protein